MNDFDFKRYNGLVARTVVKRTAEESERGKERQHLAMMLRGRTTGVIVADEPSKWTDEIHIPEAVKSDANPGAGQMATWCGIPFPELPRGLSFEIPTPPPVSPPTIHYALPKIVVGMRVRYLEVGSLLFGREGTITPMSTSWGLVIVKYDRDEDGYGNYDEDVWLRTVFPVDVTLLPPKVGMRVALAIDAYGTLGREVSEVLHGIVTRTEDGAWYGRIDSGTEFVFSETHWLRRVWPVGLQETHVDTSKKLNQPK